MENIKTIKAADAVEVMRKDPIEGSNIVYALLSEMPRDYFVPVICVMIDQFCADNDMTIEEALNVYETMLEAAKGCYKLLGMSEKGGRI